MFDNDISLDDLITNITPGDAFKILDMKVTNDKTVVQMTYHYQIMDMQNNDAGIEDFAAHRVALEVLLRYFDNLKMPDNAQTPSNLNEMIDVSYLFEGIKYLATLQHLQVRIFQAMELEKVLVEAVSLYENEESQEDLEPLDFGYPDDKEAEQLLKKIESLHLKNNNHDYAGILAEAYYQMTYVARRVPKKNDLAWYQWLYNYASKAVETDNGPIKDAEYLFMCGYCLSQSGNKDSIHQAIEYLSDVKNRVQGLFRERDVYYYLALSYYDAEEYKNAFYYAKKVMEYAPDNLAANRILGGTAYRQLTLTSNRMYAVWAAKVYTKILDGHSEYGDSLWATEQLCEILIRDRKWEMLDRLCGDSENTILDSFAYNYYKGIALMNTKREKEAVKHFTEAINSDSAESEHYKGALYANLSRCYEKIDFDKACDYMREFQQFKFNDYTYASRCFMHFFIRTKKYDSAKGCAGRVFRAQELAEINRFRIDLCRAVTDEERIKIIDGLRQFAPRIQELENRSEKNGYHVNRGSLWEEKDACIIGDIYYFLLKDDEMAIRYYELAVQITEYWLSISENYGRPKQKTSHAHYMLTRIYGEQGKAKLMKKHAEAFMDYIREYFSDDDSKTIEEQYINALDDFPYYGKVIYADYNYIKPFEEMGSQYCGDYNACKLARLYIALGRVAQAEEIAVNRAKKYRKDIPALVYVIMGDLARISGNKTTADQMYRRALNKNAWEGFEAVRYLYN